MNTLKYSIPSLKQDIIDHNLNVKAIIQDISVHRGTLATLEVLNEAGRSKLAALRKCIEKLDDWAKDENDAVIAKEVDSHREQLSRTLQAFRKANVATMLEIEKNDKQDLFTFSEDSELRQRQPAKPTSKSSLISQQESVTEKMLSISRHLSETTQKSAATLETLVSTSSTVEGTQDELLNTAGSISSSGKLLKKYGRRECTDKILLTFAFMFFIVCVIYIFQKRLF